MVPQGTGPGFSGWKLRMEMGTKVHHLGGGKLHLEDKRQQRLVDPSAQRWAALKHLRKATLIEWTASAAAGDPRLQPEAAEIH